MHKLLWLGAGLLALGLWHSHAGVIAKPEKGSLRPSAQALARVARSADTTRPSLASSTAEAPHASSLPPSLRGSVPPPLTFGPNAELALDLALRHFFDYFLTTIGELSPDALQLIREQLRLRIREPGLSAALSVLDDYLALKAAEARLRSQRAASSDLAQRVQERRALRRSFLEPQVADAFFAADERQEDYALARADGFRRGLDHDALERKSATILTPEERRAREQTFVLERLERAGEGAETSAVLAAFDRDAEARLVLVRTRQADFARRSDAYRAAQRTHRGASEPELRQLAASLGLSDRDLARLRAFEP